MKTSLRIMKLSVCLFAGLAGTALAQSSKTGIQTPAAYDSFVPPLVGGTYVDPAFGSTIKRVSNALGTPNADRGGNLTWIQNEYSAASAFNSDNSKFILVHQSYFGLYDGSGVFLHDLPFEINASSEPRWARKDNVTLYYHSANMLKSYNVATGGIFVVHTFSEYSSISGNGEMDISLDGDHFAFAGDGRYIFVYQISTGTKLGVFDTGAINFDSLYITPNNNVVVSWFPSGTVRYTGQELFDINMKFVRQVGHADGHKHLTRDTNGSEVLVWTNSNDPQPIPNCQNGIVKILLADGSQTCLAQLDWSLAVHITAPDGNGSVYVETYAPGDPAPGSPGWVAYANELLQIKLDGSGVVRLAHHRSRPWNSYGYAPKMTASRDGSRLLFGSNYDLQKISGYASDYSDAYLIVLGATSAPTVPQTPIPPVTPVTPAITSAVRFEQDNPAVEFSGSWYPNGGGFNSHGSAVLAADASSQAKFIFTGTGVKWIGLSDPWSGIAKVYLDGALVTTVDTWSAGQQAQTVQYSITNLSNAPHTLVVAATGTHGTQSSGTWLWVDAFDVTAASGSAVISKPIVTAVANSAGGGVNVAPGSLISIYGSKLAALTTPAPGTPVPVRLGGVAVSVNGISIPLTYISPGQVNAQLPFGIAPGTASLVIEADGNASSPFAFHVSATGPEIFRVSGSRALAINQDHTINSPDAPAHAGSVIVVYVNGQGAVDYPVPAGTAGLSSLLARPTASVKATLDGQPIGVSFLGLAPGLVGVSQANLQVPNAGTGDHTLVIQIGDAASQPVTIAVQ